MLKKAVALLGVDVVCSPFYQTVPISPIPQPPFLNAVCRLQTNLSPSILFDEIERIERELGKVPKPKEAPRLIDIDLLLYEGVSLETDRLTLPHPRWQERLFVLVPLRDVAQGPLATEVERLLRRFTQEEIETACSPLMTSKLEPAAP